MAYQPVIEERVVKSAPIRGAQAVRPKERTTFAVTLVFIRSNILPGSRPEVKHRNVLTFGFFGSIFRRKL